MEEMEEKLGAILNDPQMMSQIMAMAQSMNAQQAPQKQEPKQEPQKQRQEQKMQQTPEIDLAMVQKIAGFARQNNIDQEQQALLKALSPFLQKERIRKLERAMRAAKIAKFASSALGQNGLQSLLGRW